MINKFGFFIGFMVGILLAHIFSYYVLIFLFAILIIGLIKKHL